MPDELSLLEGLLKNYSPSHQEQAAVAFLVDWMNAAGFRAFADEAGNAVGQRGQGPNEIMLLGHIDTVPGQIEVRREGDLLYGRGSVDAKGPLACFAAAASRVEPPPGWRITVVGAVGEESQSHGALHLRGRYRPACLIIGEPSKWDRITLGFKGSLWIEYLVQRSMAHTASGLESAPEAAVAFWNQLKAWCDSTASGGAGPFNQLTATLRGIHSESDGFVETARLKIGLRLPPAMPPEQVLARLAELKGDDQLLAQEPIPAYRAEKNTSLVRAFLGSIRAAGGSPIFSLKTGTSDMNLVAPGWGCPAVAYGPGDSTLDHTPNEHVSVSEYETSITVLEDVLRRLVQA
jgi:LysW-gamma-L-lysine carboxypeptidase